MTIYECLGIDHMLLNDEIPKDLILENIGNEDLRNDAKRYFRVIDQVCLRASIARGEHYLQVIEVQLNTPDYIREISFLIQKAIKYRVFFVFVYEGRYLLIQRSFNLTMSTENVYTYHASFCSDWIYEEYLHIDILYNHRFRQVSEYAEADEEVVVLLKTNNDNGDYILFKDLLSGAEMLNKCIIECECISVRWFIDWLRIHITGNRVEVGEVIDLFHEHEAYVFVGDHLFLDKTYARSVISELNNALYTLPLDHTGKWPMRYFEGVSCPATFDEAEALSRAIQYGSSDILFLELQLHKAYEQRRAVDEERKAFDQKRIESELRKAAEERRRLDEWWKAWEQRRLEEAEPQNEADEKLDEDETDGFEDISFSIYDKDKIHIEFCYFEVEDDTVCMTFWANNMSRKDIKLWAMEVNVDGKQNCVLENIGVVEAGKSRWCKVELSDIPPKGCYTVDCYIEIDNLINTELDRSQRVLVAVDFDYLTQSAKLLEDGEDGGIEETAFKDIEFVAYNDDDVYVEFCNFEIDDDEVFFNFWARNQSSQIVNVYAKNIYVDYEEVPDCMHIGEFGPDEFNYGRFSLSQIKPDANYIIMAYIEIDNEDGYAINSGDLFKIEVDFDDGTLSAKMCRSESSEEQHRLEEELRRAEEQRRIEDECRKAHAQRLVAVLSKAKADHMKRLTYTLHAIYDAVVNETKRREMEELLHLEAKRKLEEVRRIAEERKTEEALQRERVRRRVEAIRMEEARLKEEARRKEIERRQTVILRREEERKESVYQNAIALFVSSDIDSVNRAVVLLQSIPGWNDSDELVRQAKEKLKRLVKNREDRQRAMYRTQKVCQHCGGRFKGFFIKVCSRCGRNKDY